VVSLRLLLLHSDWFEYIPKERALQIAEPVEKKLFRVEEVLVVMTTVEEEDDERVVYDAVDEILQVAEKVKPKEILIYPYAHLSEKLAPPEDAIKLLKMLTKSIEDRGWRVHRAPFGWYKAFRISVKGHPLAELSRRITPKKKEEKRVGVGEKKHIVVDPEGNEWSPKDILDKLNPEFRILVEKEALKIELKGGKPVIIDYLKRFGYEWESASDYGHMRFAPYAALIFDLVADYSRIVVNSLGIPVFEVKGTAFFDLKEKPIKEHAELYGDRLYTMRTDKGSIVLSYAACHQQFSIIKSWDISYRELPFGAFEIADSYRYEKSGELELCFRLRRFYMPDLHIFVKNEEEAKKWVLKVHRKIMEEMGKLNRNYELLINVVNPKQYERYKDFIVEIARDIGKPVLVAIYPPGIDYYWTINIEYHILDRLNRPREIGTVQIDIGNAKRFGITYVNKKGERCHPVIIHTAIIGSLERYIYTLFDTALSMKKPMLPVWVSPVQIRVIPVSLDVKEYAEEVAKLLEKEEFRVDIDDTDRSLSRKILDAEREWIPYIVVVGKREKEEKTIRVRIRSTGEDKSMTIDGLLEMLRKDTEGYPKRPLYFAKKLSKRPKLLKF